MNTVRKLRSWTPEHRQNQAHKMRERKIWLASTGPKTVKGKEKSSQNAYKHGWRGQKQKAFSRLIKKYALWCNIYHKLNKNPKIFTNELIDYLRHLDKIIAMETKFWAHKYLGPPISSPCSPLPHHLG